MYYLKFQSNIPGANELTFPSLNQDGGDNSYDNFRPFPFTKTFEIKIRFAY